MHDEYLVVQCSCSDRRTRATGVTAKTTGLSVTSCHPIATRLLGQIVKHLNHNSIQMQTQQAPSKAGAVRGARGLPLARAFSIFANPASKMKDREAKKAELLDLIKPLQRGVSASEEEKAEVDAAARALERLNPNPSTLTSPQVNGKWQLLYTTSTSVLGTTRPPPLRPSGPIYQVIDAVNGKARNLETWPFFNQVAADLTPLSKTKVAVQFKQFKILGLLPITAPDNARGELDITYVDDDIRISRGDKGNLFVLKMVDPNGKP